MALKLSELALPFVFKWTTPITNLSKEMKLSSTQWDQQEKNSLMSTSQNNTYGCQKALESFHA